MKLLLTFIALAMMVASGLTADEASQQAMPLFGPPPEIKQLTVLAGTWKYTGEVRLDTTSSDWIPSEATIVYSMVCGGAALQMTWRGPMMGMDMHGLSLTCYDRLTGKFTEIWIDNLMGRMSFYNGSFVDGNLVMEGEEFDPSGAKAFSRITTYDITETSHKWKMEMSTDRDYWAVTMKGDFVKQ